MMKFLPKFVLVLLLIQLPACFLVPIINGFQEVGATASARRDLLKKTVEAFHNSIKACDMTSTMQYISKEDTELREALRSELRRNKEKFKIVSSTIDFVEFDDDAYKVDVEIRTKYFLVPYYVVNERLETEKWEFVSMGTKWQLKSRKVEEMINGEPVR